MKITHLIPALHCTCMCAQAAIPADIDNVFKSYIQLAKEIEPVLAAAVDQKSADNATQALYDLLPKTYEARTALLKIESLPADVQAELIQKYGKTMQVEWGKVYEQIFRLEKANCYHSLSFFKQFRALCMMLQQ